ncbi:MAG TPA: MauE/DoxX family redox-associated membrane protein [Kribbella sp.]|uniref:MauE/DoxX family redox-associated membrane protein n=1 Tax=Kribbella sp. TaxID=1871183 RepID=UPI002D796851|nr:MauE/DoxX family redox-associated membrane protein [Kribbella sp.]HET6296624.1 MauE/DoxX family redox-associated membrane protein [Kribbella sp.]
MSYLFLACSVALSLVFGASSASKVGRSAFRGFTASAGPLKMLPQSFRPLASRAVVVAEIALTAVLLIGTGAAATSALVPVAVVGLAGAAVLLLAFTIAIVATLRRGGQQACRCFGARAIPLGPAHVVRNALLLAVALAGLVTVSGADPSVEPGGAALAGVAGLVAGLLVTRFDDLTDLFSTPEISAGGR